MKRITKPAIFHGPGLLLGLFWLLGLTPAPGRAQSGPAIFLKAVASRPAVYVGQAFTVSYLLYHRIPVIDPQNEVALTFANCYVEEYPPAPAERIETIRGQQYRVQVVRKYLLIPQLQGPLVLPTLRQRYRSSAPPAPEDFFGQPRMVTTAVRSPALRLPVRALPPPADSIRFCQAVGQFRGQLTHNISPKSNNLLTVALHLAGTGNLKNLKLPSPSLPAGLDVFNEQSREQHTLTAQGPAAEATCSYDVLANYRGAFRLAGPAPAYFDPDLGRYVAYAASPFQWHVTTGASPPTAAPAARLGRAALYIKTELDAQAGGHLFFGSRAYYGLLLLAGLVFLAGIGYDRQQQARAANSGPYRFKKARSRALRALQKVRRAYPRYTDPLGKNLGTILRSYLADKLGQEEQYLAPTGLPTALQAWAVPPVLQARTLNFVGLLGRLRFSAHPQATHDNDFYTLELASIINALDAHFHHQQAARPAA